MHSTSLRSYTRKPVPRAQNYTSFSSTQTTATKICHVLDHNGNVSKFHKGDITQAVFTYSSAIIRNFTTQNTHMHNSK